MQKLNDDYFMGEALKLAQQAYEEDEIPVGAVVVCNQRIIGKGFNQTQKLNDVTAHAEILAITSASLFLNNKYLNDCVLYVTLEPCVMCAGAIAWAQLGRLVFGAKDDKKGYSLIQQPILHPKTKVIGGISETEASHLLSMFFLGLRKK